MYYEAFSRNVNEVIDLANNLAKRFGCRYIGSEHIMFGLINVSDGRAASILREAEVDNDRYLYYFKKTIDLNAVIPGNMFTPRTKRHFEKAIDISLRAHSGFVGTEHWPASGTCPSLPSSGRRTIRTRNGSRSNIYTISHVTTECRSSGFTSGLARCSPAND